jgi:hypothetical protein
MIKVTRFIGQFIAYALFALVVGYFATQPAYTHLDPDKALIKLSFSHAGAHREECRQLTQEELNRLPPNMRRPMDCPRERRPLLVELELDGEILYRPPRRGLRLREIGRGHAGAAAEFCYRLPAGIRRIPVSVRRPWR